MQNNAGNAYNKNVMLALIVGEHRGRRSQPNGQQLSRQRGDGTLPGRHEGVQADVGEWAQRKPGGSR